jgi:hypothetical protein
MRFSMTTTYVKGRYQAEIQDQGFEQSSVKGTPCFYMQLRILARYDDQGKPMPCPQYERTYRQYLSNEIGLGILKGDLKTLGVEFTQLRQLDPAVPGHINLTGRKIDVVCETDMYDGRQVERWGIPRSRKKLDLDAVKQLDDKFGHLLRCSNSPAAPSPAVTEPNKSDEPF